MQASSISLGLLVLSATYQAWGSPLNAIEPRAAGTVCVVIDTEGTSNADYPNNAWNRDDVGDSFDVFDGEPACFDLAKTYYMSYFLFTRDDSIWYGTKCSYLPSSSDEGKVLHYIGFSGDSICPITD